MHSYWRRHWWWSCCYYYCHYYYYPGLAQREEQGERWVGPAVQHASPSVAMGVKGLQHFCFLLFAAPGIFMGHTGVRLCHVVWHGVGAMPFSAIKHLAANQQIGARVRRCWGGRAI